MRIKPGYLQDRAHPLRPNHQSKASKATSQRSAPPLPIFRSSVPYLKPFPLNQPSSIIPPAASSSISTPTSNKPSSLPVITLSSPSPNSTVTVDTTAIKTAIIPSLPLPEPPPVKLDSGSRVFRQSTGQGPYVLVMPTKIALNVQQKQTSTRWFTGPGDFTRQYQVDGWVALAKNGRPVELLAADLTFQQSSSRMRLKSFWLLAALIVTAALKYLWF